MLSFRVSGLACFKMRVFWGGKGNVREGFQKQFAGGGFYIMFLDMVPRFPFSPFSLIYNNELTVPLGPFSLFFFWLFFGVWI